LQLHYLAARYFARGRVGGQPCTAPATDARAAIALPALHCDDAAQRRRRRRLAGLDAVAREREGLQLRGRADSITLVEECASRRGGALGRRGYWEARLAQRVAPFEPVLG